MIAIPSRYKILRIRRRGTDYDTTTTDSIVDATEPTSTEFFDELIVVIEDMGYTTTEAAYAMYELAQAIKEIPAVFMDLWQRILTIFKPHEQRTMTQRRVKAENPIEPSEYG